VQISVLGDGFVTNTLVLYLLCQHFFIRSQVVLVELGVLAPLKFHLARYLVAYFGRGCDRRNTRTGFWYDARIGDEQRFERDWL